MGTDRSVEFEGPCLCGRGTFRIEDCEVDHSWPTATPQWYEPRINCPECSQRFLLEKRGNRFVLVDQAVLREQEQRKQAANVRAEQILSDEEVRSVINRFESLLDNQRSVAAVYRLLNGAGLEHCAEGTFRRHWTNARAWIGRWARPRTLEQMYQLVDAPTNRLSGMLTELRALEEYASQPVAPYGNPIHVLGA